MVPPPRKSQSARRPSSIRGSTAAVTRPHRRCPAAPVVLLVDWGPAAKEGTEKKKPAWPYHINRAGGAAHDNSACQAGGPTPIEAGTQ